MFVLANWGHCRGNEGALVVIVPSLPNIDMGGMKELKAESCRDKLEASLQLDASMCEV